MKLLQALSVFSTLAFIGVSALEGATDPGPVDLSTRASARAWFNTWWPQSFGAAMGFTGDLTNGIAGTTSQAYKDQTLLRLNIIRRLAGCQPVVTNATYDVKDQQAAMMCAVNDDLQHNPPTTWKFYNAEGADGCAHSGLAGASGTQGVMAFVIDGGDSNKAVPHREGLLQPALTTIGIGNVPPAPTASLLGLGVLAMWDSDPSSGSSSLQFTDPLVLWPGKGYIPHYIIPGRWSATIPDNATTGTLTLANVTVAVTRDGTQLSVLTSPLNGGPAVVFTLDGTSEGATGFQETIVNGESLFAPPNQAMDVVYHITISNIKIRSTGALYNGTGKYEYDVIGYNPDVDLNAPSDPSTKLINISTRSFAGADSSTQIAGFIIRGTSNRKVLIRGGGPHLTQYGVDNVLADPVLTLFAGNTVIATNDDWTINAPEVTPASLKVGAVAFPINSKDAAMVVTLQPGVLYTAQVTGKNGASGNAIVEVFDADDGSASKLVNISTRSFVGVGSSVQIGGFILNGTGTKKVLIRAGGPYLTKYGVANVLADPVLQVFQGNTQIAQNDNWTTNAAEVTSVGQQVGVVPYDNASKDSAIVLTLNPGVPYTAVVSGAGSTSGNALIEIFEVP